MPEGGPGGVGVPTCLQCGDDVCRCEEDKQPVIYFTSNEEVYDELDREAVRRYRSDEAKDSDKEYEIYVSDKEEWADKERRTRGSKNSYGPSHFIHHHCHCHYHIFKTILSLSYVKASGFDPMTQGSAVRIPAVAEFSFGINLTF